MQSIDFCPSIPESPGGNMLDFGKDNRALGGYISRTSLNGQNAESIFCHFSESVRVGSPTVTDYRCIFVKNVSGKILTNAKAYTVTYLHRGSDFSVGVDPIGIVPTDSKSLQATIISDRFEAPDGIVFQHPTKDEPILLGDMFPGTCQAIWVRCFNPATFIGCDKSTLHVEADIPPEIPEIGSGNLSVTTHPVPQVQVSGEGTVEDTIDGMLNRCRIVSIQGDGINRRLAITSTEKAESLITGLKNGLADRTVKYEEAGDLTSRTKLRKLYLSPEAMEECRNWSPSQEQADEYLRKFPLEPKREMVEGLHIDPDFVKREFAGTPTEEENACATHLRKEFFPHGTEFPYESGYYKLHADKHGLCYVELKNQVVFLANGHCSLSSVKEHIMRQRPTQDEIDSFNGNLKNSV
jgi:hypothetical protein